MRQYKRVKLLESNQRDERSTWSSRQLKLRNAAINNRYVGKTDIS